MLRLDVADLLFFAGVPALVWLLLSFHEAKIRYSPPRDGDHQRLSTKPRILQLSVRHERALRLLAFALMTAALWTARSPYWPYATMALTLAGSGVWILGISWFLAARFGR